MEEVKQNLSMQGQMLEKQTDCHPEADGEMTASTGKECPEAEITGDVQGVGSPKGDRGHEAEKQSVMKKATGETICNDIGPDAMIAEHTLGARLTEGGASQSVMQEMADHENQFEQAVTNNLAPTLLQLPNHVVTDAANPQMKKAVKNSKPQLPTRSSPRFKNKDKKRKPAVQLAQEMLAKKWGLLEADKRMEEITLQQYVDTYRQPLSQSAMAAVRKLTELAELKKKRKKEMSRKTKNKAAKALKGAADLAA
jgi:hypothetical protein